MKQTLGLEALRAVGFTIYFPELWIRKPHLLCCFTDQTLTSWANKQLLFGCPLEQLPTVLKSESELNCWIMSTTGTRTLRGQGPLASLTSPASWKHKLVSEVMYCAHMTVWLSVYLAQTLMITQFCTTWANLDQFPMQSKGLKSDGSLKSHASFKIGIQLLFVSWFGLWATCTHWCSQN